MVIDHIGIVVSSIEDGIRQWGELFGYHQSSDIVVNTRQKVRIVFLSKTGSSLIKLVAPLAEDAAIAGFARRGGGLHHLCFRCEDLQIEIPLLQAKGARFVVPPEPGEAFAGHDIAFFLARHNLNVELIDTLQKVPLRLPATEEQETIIAVTPPRN
jgi:methylmalonyl-CoA/ethylmalonyl-CoA epimerase